MKGYIQPVIYHPLARSGTLEVRIAGGTTKARVYDPLTEEQIANPVPFNADGVCNSFVVEDLTAYDLIFKNYLGNVVDSRENVYVFKSSSLSYIDEAEISLMTADSTGLHTYQLTALDTEEADLTDYCVWTSSNDSAITVSNGLVTCVGAGTATITAFYNGISKTCTITGYATMPDATARYALKGGKGGDVAGDLAVLVNFDFAGSLPFVPASYYADLETFVSSSGSASFSAFEQENVGAMGAYINVNSGTSRVIVRSGSGVSGTDYTFGPSYVANTKYRIRIAVASDGYFVDETIYTPTILTSTVFTTSGLIRARFTNNCKKIVSLNWTSSATALANLQILSSIEMGYIPQCYIRKTDTDSRTNYTIIPNLGTLGTAYNLAANNVPAGWFAV
jgi:hypothetical protein